MGAHSMGGSQSRCCGNGTRRTRWSHLLWPARRQKMDREGGRMEEKGIELYYKNIFSHIAPNMTFFLNFALDSQPQRVGARNQHNLERCY